MSQELQVIERNPKNELAFGKQAAQYLMDVVREQGLARKFGGQKEHLYVEAWQLLGQFAGLSAEVRDAEPVEVEGVRGAKAHVGLINKNGDLVGGAVAYVLRDEPNWKNKPFFQLASMAQTRAVSKAFRNCLSWIAVLGGYSGTPAEEMEGVVGEHPTPQEAPPASTGETRCPSCGKVGAIIKGKEQYGGGWVCFAKKGGCGAKFTADPALTVTEFATPAQMDEIEHLASKAGIGILRILEKYKKGTLSMLTKAEANEALDKLAALVKAKKPPEQEDIHY